jgi:hypothetical protein
VRARLNDGHTDDGAVDSTRDGEDVAQGGGWGGEARRRRGREDGLEYSDDVSRDRPFEGLECMHADDDAGRGLCGCCWTAARRNGAGRGRREPVRLDDSSQVGDGTGWIAARKH